MMFVLNDETLKVTEEALGAKREEIILSPLYDSIDYKMVKDIPSNRQIKSRGSVYLQLRRMVSVESFKKIINKF